MAMLHDSLSRLRERVWVSAFVHHALPSPSPRCARVPSLSRKRERVYGAGAR
jgi:hypothetical protein